MIAFLFAALVTLKLLAVLHRLVDQGNSVLVIEHNLDVIKTADYLIDMGPEGGDRGGTIVGTGTPEELAANPASFTGQYLKAVLADERAHGIHVDDAAIAKREAANLQTLGDLVAEDRVPVEA